MIVFLSCLAAALLVQITAFMLAIKRQRVDIVDAFWGINFIAILAVLIINTIPLSTSSLVISILVFIWAFRLSYHISKRFLRTSTQDPRYTQLVDTWPKNHKNIQLFVKIFLLQAVLATIISLPIISIQTDKPPVSILFIVGMVVAITGLLIEVTADKQLKRFLTQSKQGGLLQTGLWKYSRHPNYFGEITIWWGIAIAALATELWWIGVVGSLTITYLICFVSGIPLAEKRAAQKPGWVRYKNSTSVLVPWFTK